MLDSFLSILIGYLMIFNQSERLKRGKISYWNLLNLYPNFIVI